MKKFLSLLLAIAMLISLSACGAAAGNTEPTTETTLPKEDPVYQFSAGFSLQMPEGFVEKESQLNDFFGLGDNGAYAVIANKEEKAGYQDLNEYTTYFAEANEAGEAVLDAQGNYRLDYINTADNTHVVTVVCEGAETFYRITFYCPEANWSHYQELFPLWADTITVQ